ncbi:RluA family pseudouridine synthase [Mesobacillus maritimus]|uniref:Pseudouridine synthase n=1 Tax=Mesobacillus maritimus TaxID=1643336 RepID=A0ABS7JZE6_9BACI|nr:RluA family pseudouridine synthase [Mesobacillus maritimus]MBY0095362.1 RluA family pseudouridine synthase [Mesobacillus maritimus]
MNKCFTLNWTVPESMEGKLLREFLVEQEISKAALTDIKFKGGNLLVNDEVVTVRYRLKLGDNIEVRFPPEEPSTGVQPERIPIDILYEDSYLLVLNKPANMNTIPSREHPNGSLANAIIGYYQKNGIQATTHIVTRLDRDTSGIVVIAKHRHVHHLMSKQQKNGTLQRVYQGIAEGYFENPTGFVEEPIARKKTSIIEREVSPEGQYAYTSYQVLQQFDDFCYLQLKLKTGRTHQIRVHMSYINHPLIGDGLYGGNNNYITRQALHCHAVQFIHPIHHNKMDFTAPLPNDMKNILMQSKPLV